MIQISHLSIFHIDFSMRSGCTILLMALVLMDGFQSVFCDEGEAGRRHKRLESHEKHEVELIRQTEENKNIIYDVYTEDEMYDVDDHSGDRFLRLENNIEGIGIVTDKVPVSQFTAPLEVIKVSGNVAVESFRDENFKLKVGGHVGKWDKFFTEDKSSIYLQLNDSKKGGEVIKIEIGRQSVLEINHVDPDLKMVFMYLSKGRLRARVKSGCVVVRTVTANVRISKGYTDVILSALNTLTAPREGKSILISTQKNIKRIQPGYYGLATDSGSLFISKAISDRIESGEAIIKRRSNTEEFIETKQYMKVIEEIAPPSRRLR